MSVTAEILTAPSRVRFRVRVQPRASRSCIAGTYGTALRVRLQAPPVGGAANEALVELLAAAFGTRRGAVRIVTGEHGRLKTVEVVATDPETVLATLQAAGSR